MATFYCFHLSAAPKAADYSSPPVPWETPGMAFPSRVSPSRAEAAAVESIQIAASGKSELVACCRHSYCFELVGIFSGGSARQDYSC